MLVAAGANLNMRDINGQTPMMIAFQVDDHDLAVYLESELRLLIEFFWWKKNTLPTWNILNTLGFFISGQEKMLRTEFTADI